MGARVTRKRVVLLSLEIGVPFALLTWWWIASATSSNPFFPALSKIAAEFSKLWLFDHMLSDVLPSMSNFVIGYVIACVVGIALGTVLGLVPVLDWLFNPIIQFIRAIPAVALLPIFIAMLGFGNEVRLFIIALATLFPVLISTIDGIRSTDPLLVDVTRVYRLSRFEQLTVYLRAASPQIFAGMLVSLQVAFIVMITSEMLGSARGIGAMTLMAQKSFDILGMWAGIVLLGILGYLVNLVFSLFRRWALSWFIGAQRLQSRD